MILKEESNGRNTPEYNYQTMCECERNKNEFINVKSEKKI